MSLESRVNVLRQIAERYHELVQGSSVTATAASGDLMPALMPDTYTATVKEFERLMGEMKYDRHRSLISLNGDKISVRKLRWHVLEFYIAATTTTKRVPLQLKKGRKTAVMHDYNDQPMHYRDIIVTHRLPAAREQLADAGLAWIADSWGLRSEPMLPTAIMTAAA